MKVTRLRVAFFVMLAYCGGILAGTTLCAVIFGFHLGFEALGYVQVIALGALVLALPILALCILAAIVSPLGIMKKPILWSILAAIGGLAIYALLDPPIDRASLERGALAMSCAMCSTILFVVMTRRAAV